MKTNKNETFTSRTTKLVTDAMDNAAKNEDHLFFDRSRSYIAHKVLLQWAKKEKNNTNI